MNEQAPKTNTPLVTIDGKSLLEKDLPPISFTIEKILPQGLFIVAGSPKVGKSWLSLDMCVTVANGKEFWGNSATKGTVLYLALEDSLNRLQSRLKKYTDETVTNSNIHFAIRSHKLGDGLVLQVQDFLQRYPDTQLIIIDTMQRIRSNGNDKNAYVSDYRDMEILRQITSNYKLSLILVTHTRKMDDPDPVNMVSGSTGLVGAADGAFVLDKAKRIGSKAKLTISNRDTESFEYEVNFDKESCRWQFIADVGSEAEETESLDVLIDRLIQEKNDWSGTATELCDVLSAMNDDFCETPLSITKQLGQMKQVLKKKYGILVDFTRNKDTRSISISRKA